MSTWIIYPGRIMTTGTLYLIPTPLADGPPSAVLPEGTLGVVRRLRRFIVEEERTARRFLIRAGISTPVNDLSFIRYNEHSGPEDLAECLEGLEQGEDTGLLSEAGMPCVADPGAMIVESARATGIRVVPLTGPSSLLLALAASGFNGQRFAFNGYLPADKSQLTRKIRELEREIDGKDQTQIIIETPYRNLALFEALIKTCRPSMRLCIAAGITGNNEFIRTLTMEEWKQCRPDIHKVPAIFLLYH